jgi:hypothetical protein
VGIGSPCSVGRRFDLRPHGAITHKDESHSVPIQQVGCLNNRLPLAVKAQIARMQQHKRVAAADFVRHRMISIRNRSGPSGTVTYHDDWPGFNPFGDNSLARVLT